MVTVSVIIPTYNYANYICQAIDSALQQIFDGYIEIIVVDDGSTDDTQNALSKYIADGSIKYFYQENKGKAAATSFAIRQSSGEFIFNLDADDLFMPGKISRSVAVFQSDISIVHVASPAKIVFQNTGLFEVENIPVGIMDKAIDGNWLLQYFYNSNIIFGGGTTYAARASVLKKILIPDAVDMFIDEFLIVAVLPFGKSFIVPVPLSIWRVHQNNYSVGESSAGQKQKKARRLMCSSDALLSYFKNNDFKKPLVKLYKLKNSTGAITLLENERQKNILHIFSYAFKTFIVLRPSWQQIKKYHVINRLIPTSMFRILKSIVHAPKS